MDVFNVIGPIMVGPSSSHTAGAVKIGLFCSLLINNCKNIDILFFGSFAKTYKGHCTDRAIVGGLLGYKTNNANIKYALQNAKKLGFEMKIKTSEEQKFHPNTVMISWMINNTKYSVLGSSIGGGNIKIFEICSKKTNILDLNTILVIYNNLENNLNLQKDILVATPTFTILKKSKKLKEKLNKLKISYNVLEDNEYI